MSSLRCQCLVCPFWATVETLRHGRGHKKKEKKKDHSKVRKHNSSYIKVNISEWKYNYECYISFLQSGPLNTPHWTFYTFLKVVLIGRERSSLICYLCLNKQTLFVFNRPLRTTQFHIVLLCLKVADPATYLASNSVPDLIFLWEQLVYSVMYKMYISDVYY